MTFRGRQGRKPYMRSDHLDVRASLCDREFVPGRWTLERDGEIPRRAILTVWVVVNLVNLLQAVGFVSRVQGNEIQRAAGIAIAGLAVPATFALVEFARRGTDRRFLIGPAVFDAFVVMQLVVEYWLEVEFRSPAVPAVLVPYVSLFFGSIILMGAPMFRINRRLWLVTVATSAALLSAMLFAMGRGVG
ncbi:MAG TPA: hypothetical protein VLT15_03965 [Acidimicrobiia bacterium]|nr:hypothetical protein [Acidimicrobiia bacterium]